MKKYLSVWAMVCAGALTLAGCSDYDNGYNENAIKFTEEFRKAYGDIDPEQDWNLAERATVTVNTQTESNIKIYALRGSEYTLVGDYQGVSGTQILGVDLTEGTRHLIVSDGNTAQQCVVGDVVVFNSMSTRAAHTGTTNGITVSKITDPDGLALESNGVTYPMYKYANKEDYSAMKEVIPEINIPWEQNTGHTNLPKVTHDFSYVSTGTFIVYPYYWETSSDNEIGLYYQDGDDIKYVPIYTIKSGDEFQYKAYGSSWSNPVDLSNSEITTGGNAVYWSDLKALIWTDRHDNMINVPGMKNLGNLLNAYTDIHIKGTFKGNTSGIRLLFYKYGTSEAKIYNITNSNPGSDHSFDVTINLQSMVNQDSSWKDYLENCEKICIAGSSYDGNDKTWSIQPQGEGTTVYNIYGDVQFDTMEFIGRGEGSWTSYEGQNFCSEIFSNNLGTQVRGQGIKVDIPKGKVFGMYLKKNGTDYIFYSQSELNNPAKVGKGVVDDGINTKYASDTQYPCYASTFHVGDQLFLGFEDWPNNGDFDLNDVVLAFDGCKPTIINEDPTPGGTWLLVCEDLGGSFDTDYNDVIFKVEHISGQEFLNVTAMAAGGTLASYIVFNDPTEGGTTQDFVVGEIHEMFNVAHMPSGEYDPINATHRTEKSGYTVTIPVHKNWQIAYNVDADEYNYNNLKSYNGGDDKGANMGGFYIVTLKSGVEVSSSPTVQELLSHDNNMSVIAAPDKGEAPYILCLPYTYTKINDAGTKRLTYVWAWPQELCTICTAAYDQGGKYQGSTGGAYLNFAAWVDNSNGKNGYTSNKDWYKYKNPNGATVEDLIIKEEDIPQGVTINEDEDQKLEANFGTWAQYGYGDWANIWSFTRDGKKIAFYTGDKIVIHADNYTGTATGAISATFEDIDQTGTTFSANGNAYTITFGPNSGVTKLRIYYEGDNNYKSASILITLQVKAAQICKFTSGNYALTYVQEKLQLKWISDYAAQNWRLEDTGAGLYLMLNMGSRKYLRLKDSNDGHGIFETHAYNDIKANAFYRFAYLNDGRLQVREHNRTGHQLDLSFGTDTGINDGSTVFLDKSGGNVISWNKVNSSVEAKARK